LNIANTNLKVLPAKVPKSNRSLSTEFHLLLIHVSLLNVLLKKHSLNISHIMFTVCKYVEKYIRCINQLNFVDWYSINSPFTHNLTVPRRFSRLFPIFMYYHGHACSSILCFTFFKLFSSYAPYFLLSLRTCAFVM